jgi:hypothetical protein
MFLRTKDAVDRGEKNTARDYIEVYSVAIYMFLKPSIFVE